MKDANLERSLRERRPVYLAHPQTVVSQNLWQIAKGFDRVFTAGKNDRAACNFWGEVFAQRGAWGHGGNFIAILWIKSDRVER